MTTETAWMPPPDLPGTDLRPDPDEVTTPAGFTRAMRLYRVWAGNPSLRGMAARCGHRVSASSFQAALARDDLPRAALVREFLFACGTAEDYRARFEAAWRRVALAAEQAEGAAL